MLHGLGGSTTRAGGIICRGHDGHHDSVAERRRRPCHRTELCRPASDRPLYGRGRCHRRPQHHAAVVFAAAIGIRPAATPEYRAGGGGAGLAQSFEPADVPGAVRRHCRRSERHARPAGERARARLLGCVLDGGTNGSGISVRPLGVALAMEMGGSAAGNACRAAGPAAAPACRRLACGGAVAWVLGLHACRPGT